MSAYSGFTINTSGDPAPWGAVEEQMVKDVIDTIVLGSVLGTKDTVNGHNHSRIQYLDNSLAVGLDSSNNVVIYPYNTATVSILAAESSSNLTAQGRSIDVLATYSGGTAKIEVSSGCNITVGGTKIVFTSASGLYEFANLPTSSSGLTTGQIWNSSGTVKVI